MPPPSRRLRALPLALALALAPAALPAGPAPVGLRPFPVDLRAAGPGALDLSFLQTGPAGKDGPLRVVGGHLATADGRRIRLWGVNLTDVGRNAVRFPAKADADFWAGTLARLGVNCVRLHMLDLPAPRGILAARGGGSAFFDPVQLDRMDYFVAALKRHGIYVDLNLNVVRTYRAGDGVRDWRLIGAAKAITYFDPRVLALQRDYARRLLTHVNPYTGSDYAREPAVALIEIVNENSLVGAWIRGRLRGTRTSGPPENWQDLTPYYAAELTRIYNRWLEANLPPARLAAFRALAGAAPGEPVARLAPAQFARAPRLRFDTEASFYMDLERRFFRGMRDFLRGDLGTRALLIGTSDFSYGRSDYPTLSDVSDLDVIDAHGPWELDPMVDEPLNSVPVRVSGAAIAGKPFTVSEHNERFPSDYECEGIPLLAAYGSFQDWDGIFLYTFEIQRPGSSGFIATRADISCDPVKLANLAAGALIFRRADVRPADRTVDRSYSPEEVRASLLVPASAAGVYFTPGFSPAVALEDGSRISTFDGAPTRQRPLSAASPIVSDTGELAWYYAPSAAPATTEDDQKFIVGRRRGGPHRGVVTVDAPRVQAMIGFLGAHPAATTHLSASLENPFASLILVSLDGRPVADSGKLLLAATAHATNTGARWNAAHTGLKASGGPPTRIAPVTGAVELRGLAPAAAVEILPLDGSGTPRGPRLRARRTAGGWTAALGDPATTWYEIEVKRP
jgi:hypothetical protein